MSSNQKQPQTPIRRAADLIGGQAAMAQGLGFKDRRNVWPWCNEGRPVPDEHCPGIERLTDGRVPCEKLRPDVVWHRLPDPAWPWHPNGRPLIDVTRTMPATTPQEARDAA